MAVSDEFLVNRFPRRCYRERIKKEQRNRLGELVSNNRQRNFAPSCIESHSPDLFAAFAANCGQCWATAR